MTGRPARQPATKVANLDCSATWIGLGSAGRSDRAAAGEEKECRLYFSARQYRATRTTFIAPSRLATPHRERAKSQHHAKGEIMVPDAAGRQQQPGRVQPARRRLAKAPQQVAHRLRQAESTKRHAVAGGNTRASSGRARGPERTRAAARAMRRAEAPRVGLLQLGQACHRTPEQRLSRRLQFGTGVNPFRARMLCTTLARTSASVDQSV